MLRPLIIDDYARAEVARVMAYAGAHPYRLGQPVPGDNPDFVAHLSTYRCVFTFTDVEGVLWRHLSISVPGGKYPNHVASFMIADLFGFTGWDGKTIDSIPDSWFFSIDEKARCVIFAQPPPTGTLLTDFNQRKLNA